MKKASLMKIFGIVMVFLLVGYGTAFSQGQTQEQTQEQVETPAAAPQAQPAQTAQAEPEKKGELPAPLEAEMTVASHWTKNDAYPRTIAQGSRVHVVEKGDTLWDLAARYLGNPLLWPQIWDANKYIPNAHWIYPGDPIVIQAVEPVSEQKIAEEVKEAPAAEEPAPNPPTAAPEKKQYPIATDTDLYCSGLISATLKTLPIRIIGNEEGVEKVGLATGDVVYLNQGEAEGISPGDEFTILHRVREIYHPVTQKDVGLYVTQTGRLKVVATQEHTSTAQITFACDATNVEDLLIAFQPQEVPVMTEMPPVDRYSSEGNGTKGYVVFTKDDLGATGEGHELQIDLGAKDGIAVGTRLILYRHHTSNYEMVGVKQDLPRQVLGEMIVYNVRESTSTGRIIQSYNYVQTGDQVEVRQ